MDPILIAGKPYASPKRRFDGTHRTRSPADTVAWVKPQMERFGITRLANITGLDIIGIPVFTAIRPGAYTLATSQGKGIDDDAARASALMEAIESWHAENVDVPLRYLTTREVERRCDWLDLRSVDPYVARGLPPPDPNRHRLWMEGYDLIGQRACLVPLSLAGIMPDVEVSTHSNGLASGNHLLEAIVHGLCELIERDAHTRAQASGEQRRLDLHLVGDAVCRDLLDRFASARVDVLAHELTQSNGVPAYMCAILERREHRGLQAPIAALGIGCHLTPAIALSRALSEAAQCRLTAIAGSRDDFGRAAFFSTSNSRLQELMWRKWTATAATIDVSRTADLSTDTLEGDLSTLLERLKEGGHRHVIVCDLSRPEIGIPVVRVIAPGLRFDPAGLGRVAACVTGAARADGPGKG